MVSQAQVGLVTASWQKVKPIQDQAADLFYDRLFVIAPDVKPMFSGDLREQKRKLMAMLAMAVAGLNNLDGLVGPLKRLGAQHAGFGAIDAHYDAVGSALLWTLEQGLGPSFTPEVKEAWTEVYQTIAAVMMSGAKAAA